MKKLVQHGKHAKVDCTDEFYDDIFQDRDYEDLKQMMKLLKVKNINSS